MTRFNTRPQIFDYDEAVDQQYDMVDSVNRAGNMGIGLERLYAHQDKNMENRGMGGFWGQFSKKAIEKIESAGGTVNFI